MKILYIGVFFSLCSAQELMHYNVTTITLEQYNAKPQQFPYQASLRYMTENSPHFCSGAIISPTHVLTAARCLQQTNRTLNETDFKIVAGNTDLYPAIESFVTRRVKQYFINPNFTRDSITNDLAIVEVEREFPFNIPEIRRVLIANSDDKLDDCYSSGWGIKNYNSSTLSPILHYMQMIVVNQSKCVSSNSSAAKMNSSICVQSTNSNYFFCQGDSGDPLVCSNRLVGLASWDNTCGIANASFSMTNVTSHKLWIDSIISTSSSSASATTSYLINFAILAICFFYIF